MRKALFLTLLMTICAPLGFAQSKTNSYRKVEVFAGFSHNSVDTRVAQITDGGFGDIIGDRTGFNGFNTSITGNVSRYVGLKFDYSYHRKSLFIADATLHNFLGGVQFKDNSRDKRIKPFAHALFGVAYAKIGTPLIDFGDAGFAAAIGGGLDIRVSSRVDVRVIQFDYNPAHLFDSTRRNFRFGVGVVFH